MLLCVLAQVLFQTWSQGFCREPASSGSSRISSFLLSNISLLCLSHQQLNWGEKWTWNTKQRGGKKVFFLSLSLAAFGINIAVISFWSFSFVLASFPSLPTSALMASDPRMKCDSFSCQQGWISRRRLACRDEPMPVLSRANSLGAALLVSMWIYFSAFFLFYLHIQLYCTKWLKYICNYIIRIFTLYSFREPKLSPFKSVKP